MGLRLGLIAMKPLSLPATPPPGILDASGRPTRPPTPHEIIFAGGLNAVHLFNALGDRCTALMNQLTQTAPDMQILQFMLSALVGLQGGEVVVTTALEAAIKDSGAMLGVVKREDGSWHALLTVPAGPSLDAATDSPLDLHGHEVACRAAAKPLQQAREAKAS